MGQEVAVHGPHGHRVDHEPTTIVELQDDELEQIACAVGAEQQCSARFVIAVLACVAGERVQSRRGRMSSSATPCLRAERWISTRLECNTKIGGVWRSGHRPSSRPPADEPHHHHRSPDRYAARPTRNPSPPATLARVAYLARIPASVAWPGPAFAPRRRGGLEDRRPERIWADVRGDRCGFERERHSDRSWWHALVARDGAEGRCDGGPTRSATRLAHGRRCADLGCISGRSSRARSCGHRWSCQDSGEASFGCVRAGIRVGDKDPLGSLLTQVSRASAVESVRPRSGLYRLSTA
ncbi:MAG: hypothetical protein QOK36_889 [Gaiellales bacterium]|nr:hypothetical protein [Gaiellales bacterium]